MSDGERRGLSRRDLLRTGAVAGAVVAAGTRTAGPALASAPAGGQPPEQRLALVNGSIHTIDGADRVVRSVLIEDGRFAHVGDGLSVAGPGVRVIDLHGRTVVPGIIDNHNHIVLMGNRPGYHTPLENAYSIAEVQQTLSERATGVPAGEFITTIGGFNPNQFAEVRLPNLTELDQALPDHAAYLSIGFTGPSVTNTLGRAFFQAKGVPVGADGSIASGTPTGQATLSLRQRLTFEQRVRGVRDTMAYAASLGVTTHLDQGAFQATNTPSDGAAHEDNFTMHLPFLAVYNAGQGIMRLRINFLYMDTDPDSVALGQRLKNAYQFYGDDWVRTGSIGEFVAPDPTFPVSDGSANNLRWLTAARKVAQAGWRAEVHSLSASDYKAEIDGFALVNQEFPITDLRWVVAHVPFITSDYVAKLQALGGGLSLFGGSRYLTGTTANNGPPYRMILDSGIRTGLSCDGMQVAPLNPWLTMYYATTGVNARGQLINGGNQITRAAALRLYTEANGWFLREEDRLGSIETGKLADLVVLDRDYFTVPDADLKKIRSSLTVVGGNVVHDTGDLGTS